MSGFHVTYFFAKQLAMSDEILPVTYIAENNNNAFKILPEQRKSEEARATLKEEFKENIKTDCQ